MNNRERNEKSPMLVFCIGLIICFLIAIILTIAYFSDAGKENYGVFLGIDEQSFDENYDRMAKYKIIVIDADVITDSQIAKLKEKCELVYSYVDIGSLETYRTYYQYFEKMKLDSYVGWPDEYWMDVSREEWQDFILNEYVPKLISKGIDGLFVDNLDVYYQYQTSEIYSGCDIIMRGLNKKGVNIIINGGDTYVKKHLLENGTTNDILSGVNQEIENKDEIDYYIAYLDEMNQQGVQIYIIDYTDDKKTEKKMSEYCAEKGYYLYCTEAIDLK